MTPARVKRHLTLEVLTGHRVIGRELGTGRQEVAHRRHQHVGQRLAALLRSQIEDGTITRRLPSVKTLSQEHGVSHITAERALATLKGEGLIVP